MASKHPTEGGSWRVKWRENGRPKSKNKKTEREADAFIVEVERRLEEGKLVMRRSDVPTLAEFTAQWLASRTELADSTMRFYVLVLEAHALPFLGHLPLVDLRPRRLNQWQQERLEAGAGPAVLGKTQNVLGQILRKAVLPHEYLDYNPIDALDQPGYKRKAQRWLTAAEVEALRTWFLERDDPGSATLISVLAYVGMRPQSALARVRGNLTPGAPGWVKHTSPGAGTLLVDTKNVNGELLPGSKVNANEKYFVYVPEPVRADLETWSGTDLLFPCEDGTPWTVNDYRNWSTRRPQKQHVTYRPKSFKIAAEEVGLGKNVSPYTLRHTAATLYAAAGWNHLEVAKQLMHSPTVSAERYQHLFDQRPHGAQKFTVEDFIREARGQARGADRGFVAERS